MNSIRRSKLIWVLSTFIATIIAVSLLIYAIREQTDFYFSPSAIVAGEAPHNKIIRAGGVVIAGSVKRDAIDPLAINFIISDNNAEIKVKYRGVLPDLFAENSGVVATGTIQEDIFIANKIFAKHDENYMPPEVAHSLRENSNLNDNQRIAHKVSP